MSVPSDLERRRGVYAIPQTGMGEVLVIGTPSEDWNKFEAVLPQFDDEEPDFSEEGMVAITQGMFGLLSGGVKENETDQAALVREIHIEFGLIKELAQFTNGHATLHVDQLRPGKKRRYEAHGYEFPITEQEISSLTEKVGTNRVSYPQLESYLIDKKNDLRPVAVAALHKFLERLKTGDVV